MRQHKRMNSNLQSNRCSPPLVIKWHLERRNACVTLFLILKPFLWIGFHAGPWIAVLSWAQWIRSIKMGSAGHSVSDSVRIKWTSSWSVWGCVKLFKIIMLCSLSQCYRNSAGKPIGWVCELMEAALYNNLDAKHNQGRNVYWCDDSSLHLLEHWLQF